MKLSRPIRTALCVYELSRLAFLIWVFLVLQPEGKVVFPWLAMITPGAMYPLITLFWLLNLPRYRVYCPLYLAGKGLGIVTTMFWLFFAKSGTIRGLTIGGTASLVIPGIFVFLLLGDILSAWLVTNLIKI